MKSLFYIIDDCGDRIPLRGEAKPTFWETSPWCGKSRLYAAMTERSVGNLFRLLLLLTISGAAGILIKLTIGNYINDYYKITFTAMIAGVAITYGVYLPQAVRRGAILFAPNLLRSRRCAACGHSLPLQNSVDVVRCPECGARWRSSRIGDNASQ